MPENTEIFSPLEAEVVVSGYEDGSGNYGGRIVLRHEILGSVFYSLYGHLDPNSLLKVGTKISAGSKIAELGGFDNNGGYFHHLHYK